MRRCLKQKQFIDGPDASRTASDSMHCESGSCHAKSEAVLRASHISDLPSPHVSLHVCQSVCCYYQ